MKLRNKKTGEILGLGSLIIQNPHYMDCSRIMHYNSLAELNEEWEDYKPAEPLIKDEKIRTIVKMWSSNFKSAMIDGTCTFYVDVGYQSFLVKLRATSEPHFEDAAELDLNFDYDGLEDGKSYTIAELCGEEE